MYHNIMIFQNNADEYQYMSREREKNKKKNRSYIKEQKLELFQI